MRLKPRRKTPRVQVGGVFLGSEDPVVIQAMTDTPTADVDRTVAQAEELIRAGAEMVRVTVNNDAAAEAVETIVKTLRDKGLKTPVIGDFHFNGHILLSKHPGCARALAKYRINPGNIGKGQRHDAHFAQIIRVALEHDKPVRIGVNAGSLDQEVFQEMMDLNARQPNPRTDREVLREAMVQSALRSADYARELGLGPDRIVLSVKMSVLQDMIAVYTDLAERCDYVLHLGLTEAGGHIQGMVASAAALSVLLQQGIGDTIRVSLTPQPGVPRSREVEVGKALLQSMGLRYFAPRVTSCPGCGRTSSDYFQRLARDIETHIQQRMPVWRDRHPGVEKMVVAVMGCVVNGPGESRHAHIGISLPGASEEPVAPVYMDGRQVTILKGDDIRQRFIDLLEQYIQEHYPS